LNSIDSILSCCSEGLQVFQLQEVQVCRLLGVLACQKQEERVSKWVQGDDFLWT
jgi:hypothetical protein